MKKKIVTLLCHIAPKLMVNYAYKQVASPQIMKLRTHEEEVLNTSQKDTIKYHNFDICTYTWQGGDKKLLLVHGWEGQAGNFADMIAPLQAAGFTIYAFDAPSHGYSSKGPTALLEFIALVEHLIVAKNISHLISHSFGGVATTYSLSRLLDHHIDRYVLLTAPDKFSQRINDVVNWVGLTPKVEQLLVAKITKETNTDISKLNVSEFVKKVNVAKALVLHDVADKVVPIARAKNVVQNWSNATLEEVTGTGHFRILRTSSVIERVVGFLDS